MSEHSVRLPYPNREGKTVATCEAGDWAVSYGWGDHDTATSWAAEHVGDATSTHPVEAVQMSGERLVIPGQSPVSATLADFLLARIAEDEEAARRLLDVARQSALTLADPKEKLLGTRQVGWHAWPDVQKLAMHSLAECDAKRRIIEAEPERWILPEQAPAPTVDMATPDGMVRVYGQLITELEFRERYMELAPPSQTLLYLAMPYADHPDYREEWRQ